MKDFQEKLIYYFPELLQALEQTISMVGLAMIFTLFFGLLLGFLLYLFNREKRLFGYQLLNGLINIVRSFPFLLLVIAIIPFTRWLLGSAFGTTAAAVPLSIVGVALYGRLVEQVLWDVPESVWELAATYGVTRWQLIWHFLLVEARSGLVLAYTSVVIGLISYSTVMGIVGGGGIGDFAIRYGYQRYETGIMYTTIVIMIIFVMLIQFLGNDIAKKIDKRK